MAAAAGAEAGKWTAGLGLPTMGWLSDNAWVAWLVAAAALAGMELLSLDLVLLMLAAGALGGAAAAALGLPLLASAGIAVAIALVGLVAVRPVAVRHLTLGPAHATGTAALVGREAVVVQAVAPTGGGRVKLAGEIWSARNYEPDVTIAAGATVDVVSIDGATAVVLSREVG